MRIGEYAEHTPDQVQAFVTSAYEGFPTWRRMEFTERAVYMNSAARVLRDGRDRFATLMAREMGKPLAQGRAEVDKCAACCEFFAAGAARFLAPEPVSTKASRLANDTAFGLGAAVFTGDPARGERVAAELEAGCVFVNDGVRSDARLPFGGVKQSG